MVDLATLEVANTPPAQLLDVFSVAELLRCSPRHVCRMSDDGRMPQPVRLGTLVRWPRAAINEWVAGGCRPSPSAEQV
jgi:excisionase family DNA binding protein